MNKLVFGSATLVVFASLFIRQGGAILCWDCNSAHDPRCGEYNFDNRTVGVLDCSQLDRDHLKGIEPKYCRKVIQRIGEEVRVIRSCGWLKDEKAHGFCYTRTGTKDVMVTFCQCEGDRCNTGATLLRSSITAFAVSLLILVKLF